MILRLIGTVLASLVIYKVGETIYSMELTKPPLVNHFPGPCQLVEGVEFGSEDMEMTSDGLVFITSGFSPRAVLGESTDMSRGKGQILLFDMKKPQVKVTPLKIILSKKSSLDTSIMTPHGISLYEDQINGIITIFMVNHPIGETDRIEKFHYRRSDGTLTHIASYTDDTKVGILNDVVATGENTFYTSLFYYCKSGWKVTFESNLQLKWGGLLYYDGMKFHAILPSGSMYIPNGLGVSKDKKLLYVISDVHYLKIFKILDDASLELQTETYIPCAPDNIFVEHEADALWTGCHPITWKVISHLTDSSHKAPSEVIRIQLDGANVTDMTDILKDNGDLITASTVATHWKGRLLVGTIKSQLLYCDIKMAIRSIKP